MPASPGQAAAPAIVEFATHVPIPGTGATSRPADWGETLRELRSSIRRQVDGVLHELERGSPPTHSTTEMCWLNGSIRTWATLETFAEVAGDPAVAAVDLPQTLEPDSMPSGDDARLAPGGDPDSDGVRSPEPHTGHPVVDLRPGPELSGHELVVAVIDSEVATHHAALEGRVLPRHNFTTEPWGRPHQHGTALAGIIASGDPVHPGIATGVVVHNYKVLASARRHNSDDFAAALALQYALEDGAAVALCAWGAGPIGSQASRSARAVDQAWALGMVVVKSAGNGGPRPATMSTPAEANGVLVVGATDLLGTQVQPYSSRGPAGSRPGPHCVAPGGTWGTDPSTRLTCARVSGGFGSVDVGTSYAAAFAAGAAALYRDRDRSLAPDDVRRRIVADAIPVASDQGIEAQGAGLLQIRP